jgi:Holliday junction resolvasome RuvABC endonuclease subunit
MALIRIAALDGSLTNFGIAKMDFNTDTGKLSVADLTLVKTEKSKAKSVRVSSDRLRRSKEIADTLRASLEDCVMFFAEVPTGAQSSDAAFAFGIVVGLYASIDKPMSEVSPSETKMAAVGTKTASKQEMINWAVENFPEAPWRTYKRNGEFQPTLDNEHLADAVAIAHAGIKTEQFKQMISIFKAAQAAA